ncbi:membrane protein [Desulfolithobacter dissulfuricans]|uniref:Membrane protein n=1 Tax=Desulfolithobacter dissulfuricans TaxID=2795293 RepID=A0A915U5V6_9BACT|nr:efflux RND transporter periplasmic adaptor subunit [Desulfolithobacter dissulfuricans]BCO09547.1 membrane protein [Desulfolithobacter dissulfuricans]
MGKFRTVLVGMLVLAAGVAGGRYLYATREAAPQDVLTLYGNVDIRQVQLAFQDVGRITAVHVQEGDQVKKGDLLAEIDDARYRARLQQLEGELEAQKHEVARLEAGSRPQEIARARARVAAEEARVKNARLTYERLSRLVAVSDIAKQKADDARTALETAVQSLEAAKKELELVILGPRQEDIAAARAKLRAREAAVELARRELADTRLHAPTSGLIRDRILEPGDMASPATPVLTLALTDPLWVRAYCPETELGRISPGMIAAVSTDSYPGKSYRGWIGYISPVAEFTPKNVETPELRTRLVYQVRVFVCDPRNELRLGMPATVSVDLTQARPPGQLDRATVCQESPARSTGSKGQ